MSSAHSRMGNRTDKEKTPDIHKNKNLEEFLGIQITSPNKRKDPEYNRQTVNQETSGDNKNTSDTLINQLKNSNNPDATYNYKKDFLVLAFNQTEDQNSLEYKRKILAKKLMTDITFSLNKAFEFSFEDQIKNNIIMTLSKHNKKYYDYEEKKKEIADKPIDNEFILNFCNGEFDMNNFFLPDKENELEKINLDMFLGNKNTKEEIENSVMEDEIAHAKKNYAPMKGPHAEFNIEKDEPFDIETYKFFKDFIDRYENEPLAAKVKLVLSYIEEKNPHTNKAIYTNKEKNQILHLWKSEYDNAYNDYCNKIIKEKRENKMKKKSMMIRESVSSTINLMKKKTNKNSINMPSKNNNNGNNDLRTTGNFNYDNNMKYKKSISMSMPKMQKK